MSKWLRWYQGTCEDGKFRAVSRNAGVTVATVIGVWAALLEDASRDEHRGVVTRNEDFIAAILDMEPAEIDTILQSMQDFGLISVGAGAITINKWNERQFETDSKDPTNADRQRRHREKRKTVTKPDTVTERNGAVTVETRPDTDTDTDTDNNPPTPQGGEMDDQAEPVILKNGSVSLDNRLWTFWLEQFAGDKCRLLLALVEVAGRIQPNSSRPLEAQVGSQLARIAGDKRDRDKRYQDAVKTNAKAQQAETRQDTIPTPPGLAARVWAKMQAEGIAA